MSMARIKDAAASSMEPQSRLINQELQDESIDESAGILPRLATVKVFFLSLANKDQPSYISCLCLPLYVQTKFRLNK